MDIAVGGRADDVRCVLFSALPLRLLVAVADTTDEVGGAERLCVADEAVGAAQRRVIDVQASVMQCLALGAAYGPPKISPKTTTRAGVALARVV